MKYKVKNSPYVKVTKSEGRTDVTTSGVKCISGEEYLRQIQEEHEIMKAMEEDYL